MSKEKVFFNYVERVVAGREQSKTTQRNRTGNISLQHQLCGLSPLFDVGYSRPSFDVCFWTKYYRSLDVIFKVRCFERVSTKRREGRGECDLAMMGFHELKCASARYWGGMW